MDVNLGENLKTLAYGKYYTNAEQVCKKMNN